ncbi:MAG: hypothetical protein ACTSVE_06975 [Candidatus Helarchaeota archaeon]
MRKLDRDGIEANKNTVIQPSFRIKTFHNIDNEFKKIKDLFNGSKSQIAFSKRGTLYFLQGYDENISGKDDFTEAWIAGSFIEKSVYYQIAFMLGRYYYQATLREIYIIKNKGLIKQIISWGRNIEKSNLLKLFNKINVSYFHSLRIEKKTTIPNADSSNNQDKKSKLDNLSTYRKNIEDLFAKIEEDDSMSDDNVFLIRLSFMLGFLIRLYPNEIKLNSYSNLAFHDLESISPETNEVIKLIYTLGSLMRYTTIYEMSELKTRSFKNFIMNFRLINYENILKFILYISKILLRYIVNDTLKDKLKLENDERNHKLSYNYLNLYHGMMIKFIKIDTNLKIDPYISSIAFMQGYSYMGIKKER